jgi:hypothetical protein
VPCDNRCVTEGEDLRTFIREILLRFDRGMAQVREDSRRYFERLDAEQKARHEENREKLDEVIAEGRAGREALFRMLDKMDNGGTAPAG